MDQGNTGSIIPPRDPEALADTIVELLKEKKLKKQRGKNLKVICRDIAEKMIEVYKKAIEDAKKK